MAYVTTTDEYWEFDGVPLNTPAWNCETFGGSRFGLPPLRGTDVEQAYRPGVAFRPKVAGPRVITMAMWVVGADPENANLGADHVTGARERFISNLRFLQKLFYTPRRQGTLTRRWVDMDGAHVVTTKAQMVSQMEPNFTGPTRAVFTVDLLLSDPFFYGSTVTSSAISVGGSTTITNPGDDATPNNLIITFTGPLTNPRLTNSTPDPDIWCQYTGVIGGGDTVVLDIAAPRAVTSGGIYPIVNTLMSSAGSFWWMELFPGANALALTGSGAGSAQVSYQPAYV